MDGSTHIIRKGLRSRESSRVYRSAVFLFIATNIVFRIVEIALNGDCRELEEKMGFRIRTIQVDNGYEFVNDDDKTSKSNAFEHALESLGIKLRRTRPYSPWQNGKVERSHREDGKILYNRRVFTSEKELIEQVEKHQRRYNKTAKTVLNFKSPNQVVAEFFQKCNICVDN